MNLVSVKSDRFRTLPAELRVGSDGGQRLMANGAVVQRSKGMRGLGDGGLDAQAIADLITQSSAAILPAIVASQPGTQLVRQADGSIMVYSQPTGTTANLPGVYGNTLAVPTNPGATLTTGVGQLAVNASGLNLNSLMIAAGLGLVAVMMMKHGK